jgi:hypothetical protein
VLPVLGWLATVMAVAMYLSYVAQIRLNLDGHKGSLIQPLATVGNCALWATYGLLKPARLAGGAGQCAGRGAGGDHLRHRPALKALPASPLFFAAPAPRSVPL